MTAVDVVWVLILPASGFVLGLAVVQVIRQAQRQRSMAAARQKQLREMLLTAWSAQATIAYAQVTGNTIGLTDSVLEAYWGARDALADATALSDHLLFRKDVDLDAIGEFMQAFIIACRDGYSRVFIQDITAELLRYDDAVQTVTAYLRATSNPTVAVAALRSGVAPEYAGEL